MQEGTGCGVASDPESDEVSAELAVSEQSVVSGGSVEGGVEVPRKSTFSQSQILHLTSCLLVTLLQIYRDMQEYAEKWSAHAAVY